MAARKKAEAELDADGLARIVDEVTARVRSAGAVARATIEAPKASVPIVLDRLAARGLEVRPRFVRIGLATQLDALLARGGAPVAGLEKRVAGGATRAEVRAALTRMVQEGRALVVRGGGKDGFATRPPDDVLEPPDRARVAAVARALATLAKAPGKGALAPRARWADVRELLADVLDAGTSPPDAREPARSLLESLRATADASGVSPVADAARLLDPVPSAAELAAELRALASRGAVELRIASQPHLLSADARALCPTDPAGRVLAYARVLGG